MPDPPRPRVPGIPGAALPPPRAKQATFPDLPSALPKRPERTHVGAAGPPAAGSAPAPVDVAPHSTTLESSDPRVVATESPPRGQPAPRQKVSPAYGTPATVIPALRREVERQGGELVDVPVSTPAPSAVATPLQVSRPRIPPWWEREEAVAKVIGALVAGAITLGGAGLIARGSGDAPPPVKQGDIECPAFADAKSPRGALCNRIHELEGMVGALQAVEHARRAAEEREKKMLGQDPPTIQTPK